MFEQETIVSSLLNEAQPALAEGWDARPTGCDELTVRNLGLRRYAVLPAEAEQLLPLLDGTRSLNDIAGTMLAEHGRVRHQVILDALARLFAAGLLQPLQPELEAFLQSRHQVTGMRRAMGRLRSLADFGLYLPIRLRLPRRLLGGAKALIGLHVLVFLALYILSVIPYAQWLSSTRTGLQVFGPRPAEALVAMTLGMLAALSLGGIARTKLLLLLGRSVHGVGLRFTLFLPHPTGDPADEVMLNRSERLLYRSGVLTIQALGGAVTSLAAGRTGSPGLFYLGLGIQLVLFANLSPIWSSDLSAFIEEIVGYRRMRRHSHRYLLRRLWRELFRRKNPAQSELALILFTCLWFLYIFAGVLLLGWLLPGTVDGVSRVLFSSRSGAFRNGLALLVSSYLWLAFIAFLLAILAAVVAGLAQVFGGRQEMKAFDTRPVDELSHDKLADELMSIHPFSGLPRELVLTTLKNARMERYQSGATIIRQGDPGDQVYVLRSGHCRVQVEDVSGRRREVGRLEPGFLFGEVAVLSESLRTGSVVATSDVEVLALDGPAFLALVEQEGQGRREVLRHVRVHLFLHEVDLFRGLSPHGMDRLFKAVQVEEREKDEVVITIGDAADSMYLIFSGSCRVTTREGQTVAELKAGDYFGEIALVTGTPRTATVTCLESTVLLRLDSQIYQDVIVREFATGVLLDREVDARLEELSLL